MGPGCRGLSRGRRTRDWPVWPRSHRSTRGCHRWHGELTGSGPGETRAGMPLHPLAIRNTATSQDFCGSAASSSATCCATCCTSHGSGSGQNPQCCGCCTSKGEGGRYRAKASSNWSHAYPRGVRLSWRNTLGPMPNGFNSAANRLVVSPRPPAWSAHGASSRSRRARQRLSEEIWVPPRASKTRRIPPRS